MPTLETSVAFFGIAVLLAFAPGPDNLFVMLHSAVHGRRAGMLVVLGLCTGLIVHTGAVALGLAAVFASSALAFDLLKLCGATYLVWLAWQALRAPAEPGAAADAGALSPWRTYGRGVLMNLSNPKVAIFFLAFLPQFARPAAGSMAVQMLCLGGIFILATLVSFGAIAYFAGAFGTLLRRSARVRRWMNRVAALVFVGLAARLALSDR